MIDLSDGKQFLEAIDKEKSGVVVVVHIYSMVSCFMAIRNMDEKQWLNSSKYNTLSILMR